MFRCDDLAENVPREGVVVRALQHQLAGALVGHDDVVVLEMVAALVGLAIEGNLDLVVLRWLLELLV